MKVRIERILNNHINKVFDVAEQTDSYIFREMVINYLLNIYYYAYFLNLEID